MNVQSEDQRYRLVELVAPSEAYNDLFCFGCGWEVGEFSGTLVAITDIHDDTGVVSRFVRRCEGKWCRMWHEVRTVLNAVPFTGRVEVILGDQTRQRYKHCRCPACGIELGYLSDGVFEQGDTFLESNGKGVDVACTSCFAPFTVSLAAKITS